MGTFQTEMFASKPIIPMRPAKYIKHPPARKVARIKKYAHQCRGDYELHLTAKPHNGTDVIGYDYYLTCTTCKKIVGEMLLPQGLDKMREIHRFIETIERDL